MREFNGEEKKIAIESSVILKIHLKNVYSFLFSHLWFSITNDILSDFFFIENEIEPWVIKLQTTMEHIYKCISKGRTLRNISLEFNNQLKWRNGMTQNKTKILCHVSERKMLQEARGLFQWCKQNITTKNIRNEIWCGIYEPIQFWKWKWNENTHLHTNKMQAVEEWIHWR